MLERIENVSEKINDNDYRLLMKNIKELKDDYDNIDKKLKNLKPKHNIVLGFKVEYTIIKPNINHFNTINIDTIIKDYYYMMKLSKEDILLLSKHLEDDVEKLSQYTSSNGNMELLLTNLMNLKCGLLNQSNYVCIKICDDCNNADSVCECQIYDTTNSYTYNCIDCCSELTTRIKLISIKNKDNNDKVVNKKKYFDSYFDRWTFKTYIEKTLFE